MIATHAHHAPHVSLSERIAALRHSVHVARTRRRIYNRAMDELNHLDQREMMELGISPFMFHEIALQEVARKLLQAA